MEGGQKEQNPRDQGNYNRKSSAPEGEEKEDGAKKLLEEVMAENLLHVAKDLNQQTQEAE